MECSFKLYEKGFTNQCPFKSSFASNLVALTEGGGISTKNYFKLFCGFKKGFHLAEETSCGAYTGTASSWCATK